MRDEVETTNELKVVPLQDAVLCVDCEAISNSPQETCLVCGSRSLVSLSRVLGGCLPAVRAKLIERPLYDSTNPDTLMMMPSFASHQPRQRHRLVQH